MLAPANDPRTALARALAETHLETMAAEHDYRRTLADGADHMEGRFPASALGERPGELEHWSWHRQAMADAMERGGLGEIPALPFAPAVPTADAPAE